MDQTSSRRGEQGQTMAEYAVVLALVLIACVASFPMLSNAIGATITSITAALS